MLSFWSDPHQQEPPFASDGSIGAWDAIARAAMPAARAVARPGDLLPIVVHRLNFGALIVRAHWGFVPAWAKPADEPALALRFAVIDRRSLAGQALIRTWQDQQRCWRCLVPSTGWIADVAGVRTAFRPGRAGDQPLTFAGVYSERFELGTDGKHRGYYTFGIITTARADRERFAHRAPVVIGVNSREPWLTTSYDHAQTILGNAQPPAVERVARGSIGR